MMMSHCDDHLLAYWGLPTFTWAVMWSVLGVLTVVLLVLLRTRWSKAKPWRRYAALSLWVHVLLAFAAMTVRIVTGPPDSGEGETIRVSVLPAAVVEEEAQEQEPIEEWQLPSEQLVVAPDLAPLEPPTVEPVEVPPDEAVLEEILDTVSDLSPSPPLPLEAPLLMPEPEVAEQAPTQDEVVAKTPADSDPVEQVEEEIETVASESENVPAPTEPPMEATGPQEPTLTVPKTYADRFARNRDEIAQRGGGSAQTERAVRAALGWLAEAQSENGGWDASRFGAGKERNVLGEDRQGAGQNADTGVTGLALLAFLGSGHTHLHGDYTYEVAAGLDYLRQRQRSDGALHGNAQLFARMYCHSMATFAVCEALALTGDKRLEPVAGAAIRYTLSMQHPTDGGWRYRRGDTGDTSQLGWQLMTLKSADLASLRVPASTWSLVERYLRRVRRGRTGGLASYRPEAPATRTMTAEALFCRQLLRNSGYGGLSTAELHEALRWILQERPASSMKNLYFWYYATLALHQAKDESEAAADAWEDWNRSLTTVLLTTQQNDGSWNTDTTWGGYGGRVYTTALSAMCLEVYYRYVSTDEASEMAIRPWQTSAPYR